MTNGVRVSSGVISYTDHCTCSPVKQEERDMGWTKTDVEGQIMWERDGERVREVPRDTYRTPDINYQHNADIPIGFVFLLIGFIVGLILGLNL